MNIKQAEALSGVSKQNIRFYEREGLISPDRNPENDYREYREEHIQRLKLIRVLRMLDMPLDSIREVLQQRVGVSQAAVDQQVRLEEQRKQLSAAIRFCEELREVQTLNELNVDELLSRMERPENQKSLSEQWLEDYRKVVLSEHEKTFTFIPEGAVTTAREFTAALFAYANANDLDLTITREGMYPEFTINGIEYTAERFYTAVQGIPVATIRCRVKYPEDFEPDVPEYRKKYMKLLNLSWLLIPYGLVNLVLILHQDWRELLSSWEGWLLLLSFAALAFTSLYRTWLYHFNENGKTR